MLAQAISIVLLFCFLASPLQAVSAAPPQAAVTDDKAVIDFPNSITFKVKITAGASIVSIVLEYGADQLTCGTVIAKAFPQFQPNKSVSVEGAEGFAVAVPHADHLVALAHLGCQWAGDRHRAEDRYLDRFCSQVENRYRWRPASALVFQ
jgi:hypothetical protein